MSHCRVFSWSTRGEITAGWGKTIAAVLARSSSDYELTVDEAGSLDGVTIERWIDWT